MRKGINARAFIIIIVNTAASLFWKAAEFSQASRDEETSAYDKE
jgi:hypothetical protein